MWVGLCMCVRSGRDVCNQQHLLCRPRLQAGEWPSSGMWVQAGRIGRSGPPHVAWVQHPPGRSPEAFCLPRGTAPARQTDHLQPTQILKGLPINTNRRTKSIEKIKGMFRVHNKINWQISTASATCCRLPQTVILTCPTVCKNRIVCRSVIF